MSQVLEFLGVFSFVIPVIVVLFIILSFWKKVPADKAMVITGLKRG